MKLIPSQMQLRHLLVRYFDTGWIGAGIKLGVHSQAFGRRRARDQTNDDCQARQWLTAPVLTDEAKQPVFNLIPFAGARRKVADRYAQPVCMISGLKNWGVRPPTESTTWRTTADG